MICLSCLTGPVCETFRIDRRTGSHTDAPSLAHAFVLENRTQILAGFSNDPAESITAFRPGRAPRFGG